MTATAAALRVGWCPGALRPMTSGDGLIVRLKPRGMALSVGRARGIAAAASRHGSGLLDLTGRANLQIRGLADAALPALTDELDALGLLDADAGAEARRNVVASPLMGLDPTAAFDVRPAVAALEAALAAATGLDGLPSKFGFAVSDGGNAALGGVSADVCFDARPDGRFAVRLDGSEGSVASCAAEALPDAALELARIFVAAAVRNAGLGRMRDLVAATGAAAVAAHARLAAPALPPAADGGGTPPWSGRSGPVGAFDVAGIPVFGVAAPFGRLDAAQLDALARGAAEAGAAELRLTPWRILLVAGIATLGRYAAAAAAAGFIVDPADPRLRVAACVGAPGCRRGTTPVQDHAALWSGLLGPGDGVALHVSGCAKGCAHPGPAPLTVVASGGLYAVVADGAASNAAVATGLDAGEVRRLLKTVLRLDGRP